MDTVQTAKLGMQFRKANVKAKTFDKEKRTVEVVFSKGTRIKRRGWFTDDYYEELALKPENVRLDRLNNGAPFLNNHSSWALSDALGVIESAEVDGKQGTAKIRFSEREDIQDTIRDIENGIIQNVSVGYVVHAFEEKEAKDGLKIYRATDWEPYEVSAVLMPADAKAKIRSEELENVCTKIYKRTLEEKGGETMAEPKKTDKGTDPIVDPKELEKQKQERDAMKENEIKKEAVKAEKERQAGIRHAVDAVGLEAAFATDLIDKDVVLDEARKQIIDKAAEIDKTKETIQVINEPNKAEHRKDGMTNALLHRVNPRITELSDHGKQYRHMNLMEMARETLEANGIDTRGWSKPKLAKQALLSRSYHSISDFPEILADAINKTLRKAYDEAPQTFMPFTEQVQVADFKQISRTALGDAPSLLELEENAEIKRGSIGEEAEKYNVKDYARMIGISRKIIINDDLNAFSKLPMKFGRAARDLESDLAWAIIVDNAAMADGVALFHADHGNLAGSGAVPSDTTLSAGRQAMRDQVGINGAILNLWPFYIAGPTSLETTIEKLLTSIQPNESGKVNAFAPGGNTPLQGIIEPRLAGNVWYLFTELAKTDMVEMAFLEGQGMAPVIDTKEGWDILGLEMRVLHTVGAKALDHRGMYKNPGA